MLRHSRSFCILNGTDGRPWQQVRGSVLLNIQSTTHFSGATLILPTKGIVSVRERKVSYYLPAGSQAQLIDAAVIAELKGHSINCLTTIRTDMLREANAGLFADKHPADAVATFLELVRKWHKKRGIPWACIWDREVGKKVGEHLHMGTHTPEKYHGEYADRMASWTGEDRIFPKYHKPDAVGLSARDGWLIQCCHRSNKSGQDIAAYMGKDEPAQRLMAYGRKRDNKAKRVTAHFGYGGLIEGTHRCEYRHGTSRNIAPTIKANQIALEKVSDKKRYIKNLDWLPY